jgi:spore germination protein KC
MRWSMLRKVVAAFVVSLGSLLLPGCDIKEVDDLNVVLALGIDQTDNGLVRVTAQIVNPAAVPSAGASESGNGATGRAFIVRVETGSSIEEAVEKFNQEVPHQMYLAHNTLVVFGNAYAQHGIERAFDYLERDRYYRRNELLVVTSGTAEDLLSASTNPDPLNAMGIRALVQQTAKMFRIANSEQQEVMQEYLSPSQAPVVSLVDLDPANHPVMKGVAVFRGAKLADTLTLDETKALAWLLENTRQVEIHLPCDGRGSNVGTTVRLIGSNTQVTPQFRKNGVSFLVTVRAEAEIERLCPYERMSEKTYKELEKKTAEYMEREIQAVVAKLQSDGVDASQFGTRLFTKNPRYWRQISQSWPDDFAKAQVTCNVRVHVFRSSLSSGTPESTVSQSGLAPPAGRGVTVP